MPRTELRSGGEQAISSVRVDRAGILWFLIQVILAIIFLANDASSRLAYLYEAQNFRVVNKVNVVAPASPNTENNRFLRQTILPATAIDARWWVMHTAQNMQLGQWRTRTTDTDNAPHGRDVHWSSALPWLLESMARISAGSSGKEPHIQLQKMPLYAGPVMFGILSVLLACILVPGFGWKLAGFSILMLATSFPVLEMFRAGETDHHGLAMMFALGNVFCLLTGMINSSGQSDSAEHSVNTSVRKWFVVAGVLGAGGMWISAATMIPILVACGLGALAASFGIRNCGRSSMVNPANWWYWGVSGCLGSLVFYALEYLPNHATWRLEVNHPIHALAWLSAAAVLRQCCGWLSGTDPLTDTRLRLGKLALTLTGVLLPVVVIAIFGPTVFKLTDPWLLAIHKNYIREFATLWSAIQADGGVALWFDYFAWPVFALAGLTVCLSNFEKCRCYVPTLVLAFVVAIVTQGMAVMQIRWSGLALGMWSTCVVCLVGIGIQSGVFVSTRVRVKIGLGVLAAIALFAYPISAIPELAEARKKGEGIPRNLVPALLLRDISHRIVRSSPDSQPVVLTDPTSATDMAYFGGLRVVGTFYWENLDGLKRTSRIFAAPTEQMARDLMREAGITHVVLPTWDAFSDISAHIALMKLDGFISPQQTSSFWQRIVEGGPWPDWLRPYYHGIPAEFGATGQRILFFQVCPEQSAVEAAMYRGVYYAESGALKAAQECFRDVLKSEPSNAAAAEWLAGVTEILEKLTPNNTDNP